MEEKTSRDFFKETVTASNPDRGITTVDYINALESQVKKPLILVYEQLCGYLEQPLGYNKETVNTLLAMHRNALLVWEHIDEAVLADAGAKFAKISQ